MSRVSLLVVAVLLVSSCASSGPSTPRSTATPKATPTARPTNTVKATEPPKPTNTAKPTNTRATTSTPVAPTATPKPVRLSGSGDSIQDFKNPFQAALVHITGNADSRYFGVTSYGADGEQLDLLVNTTDPYDGIRPLDFDTGQQTVRFEIKATGKWTIDVAALASARTMKVPGTVAGKGDDVIALSGGKPDLAKIKGNAAGRYFGVFGYGRYSDLLVNTTDPYEGTVIVAPDTLALEIQAVGAWSVEVTGK